VISRQATLLQQIGNSPTVEDGVDLFYRLTQLTVASSLQLSLDSVRTLIDFAPGYYNFSTPQINTRLNHLFLLATTRNNPVTPTQRLLHTLTAYCCILQPNKWARWISEIRKQFDNHGTRPPFPYCSTNNLMQAAIIKYNKIVNESQGNFHGSSISLRDDIIAQVVAKRKAPPAKAAAATGSSSSESDEPDAKKKLPPFIRHWKASKEPDSTKYKLGDTKVWSGETWHFCDCPNHCNQVKWHTYAPSACGIRTAWLAKNPNKSSANAANIPSSIVAAPASVPPSSGNTSTSSATSAPSNDIAGYLAAALALAGSNSVTYDCITEALAAL
jgi:hypothetical protein